MSNVFGVIGDSSVFFSGRLTKGHVNEGGLSGFNVSKKNESRRTVSERNLFEPGLGGFMPKRSVSTTNLFQEQTKEAVDLMTFLSCFFEENTLRGSYAYYYLKSVDNDCGEGLSEEAKKVISYCRDVSGAWLYKREAKVIDDFFKENNNSILIFMAFFAGAELCKVRAHVVLVILLMISDNDNAIKTRSEMNSLLKENVNTLSFFCSALRELGLVTSYCQSRLKFVKTANKLLQAFNEDKQLLEIIKLKVGNVLAI